ncbi:hypothetical protein [Treponema sp.]|uniref:hypothetical protein n=1 Tax=Treponema sp. TaxID=166 RepID=UPI00388DF5D0
MNLFKILSALPAVFLFSSCMFFQETAATVANYLPYTIVTATETVSYSYDSSNPAFKVSPSVKTVNISGIPQGKSVYIAKVNPGNSTVSSSHTRCVYSSDGYSRSALSEFSSVNEMPQPETKIKYFNAPKISLENDIPSQRSASFSTLPEKTVIDYQTGDTKQIYVDTGINSQGNIGLYQKKQATLRAKGTYCYVWVVNSYYTEGAAGGSQVNSAMAEKFRNSFDSFYEIVRNIFGEESDNIIYSYSNSNLTLKQASSQYPMSSYSDTGTKVNIVLYDIGNDYENETKCGVAGYFYEKDYYSQTDYTSSDVRFSNQGKYFYIDTVYANSDPDGTLSTLVHEFQHMINFGVKEIDKDLDPDQSYNEMLSMLCEDMMSEHLGLTDSNNVKAERIPMFNIYYFTSGIREYLESNSVLSYATSYAFGSWLCRQYGGAALVSEIMSNPYVDNESLVNAVNTLNSTSYTFDELFRQFLLACTKNLTCTHNKTVTYTKTDGTTYTYPMTAIDLWSDAYSYPKTGLSFIENQQEGGYEQNKETYNGPFLFSNNTFVTLRPKYGMTLHKLGTTTSNSLSLTFSSTGADCITMYVIIQ